MWSPASAQRWRRAFRWLPACLGRRISALAGQYVRAHPPRSPVLSGFGAALPGFLADFAPLRRLGYLPDVARLELALRDSYHAADAAPLPPEALQALPPERLAAARLRLAPAVRLVVSDWPIVAIWRFNREDGPKPAMAAEGALVSRPGYDPVIASLTPAGAAFVAALAAEKPLGAALEAAAARDAAFDPAPTLGALISGGALVSLEEPAP